MTEDQSKSTGLPLEHGEPIDIETAIRRLVLPRDPRFSIEAYLFLFEALEFTVKLCGRNPHSKIAKEKHVTGGELLEGIRLYALEQFGRLAPTVFRQWGLKSSADFGDMVFNLVEAHLMSKTEEDSREDFAGGFSFEDAFDEPISLAD